MAVLFTGIFLINFWLGFNETSWMNFQQKDGKKRKEKKRKEKKRNETKRNEKKRKETKRNEKKRKEKKVLFSLHCFSLNDCFMVVIVLESPVK